MPEWAACEHIGLLIVGHSSLGTHRVSIGFLTRFHKRDNLRFVYSGLCGQAVFGEQFHVVHTGDPRKGTSNGPALDGQPPTFQIGVQPCPPAGHTGLRVNQSHRFTGAVCRPDHPYELVPDRCLPASNTCPDRRMGQFKPGVRGTLLRCRCFLCHFCRAFNYWASVRFWARFLLFYRVAAPQT